MLLVCCFQNDSGVQLCKNEVLRGFKVYIISSVI